MTTPDNFAIQYAGGFETPEFLQNLTNKTVLQYPVAAFCVIVVLSIIVVWLFIRSMADHFNPTQNLRDLDSDQFGLGKKERLDAQPSRAASAFAQLTQSATGSAPAVSGPLGAAATPGTAAYQVLHSSEFDCANRKPLTQEDAWGWLVGAAKSEGLETGKPQTDGDFSKTLAGY